jgi:hypothetical protein
MFDIGGAVADRELIEGVRKLAQQLREDAAELLAGAVELDEAAVRAARLNDVESPICGGSSPERASSTPSQ